MSFSPFVEDTTITTSQMNGNFQAIGSGNWLPLGGANLEATTGIYDLGSTVSRWKDVYTNSLNVSGYSNGSTWNLLADVVVSTINASILEITGFTGDVFYLEIYMDAYAYVAFPIPGYFSSTVYIQFNIDGTGSHGYNMRRNSGSLERTINTGVTAGVALTDSTVTVHHMWTNILLYAKPGYERLGIVKSFDWQELTATMQKVEHTGSLIWNNTSDTLTSIRLRTEGNPAAAGYHISGSIKLWSKS